MAIMPTDIRTVIIENIVQFPGLSQVLDFLRRCRELHVREVSQGAKS